MWAHADLLFVLNSALARFPQCVVGRIDRIELVNSQTGNVRTSATSIPLEPRCLATDIFFFYISLFSSSLYLSISPSRTVLFDVTTPNAAVQLSAQQAFAVQVSGTGRFPGDAVRRHRDGLHVERGRDAVLLSGVERPARDVLATIRVAYSMPRCTTSRFAFV
jgi:hypothetical protein